MSLTHTHTHTHKSYHSILKMKSLGLLSSSLHLSCSVSHHHMEKHSFMEMSVSLCVIIRDQRAKDVYLRVYYSFRHTEGEREGARVLELPCLDERQSSAVFQTDKRTSISHTNFPRACCVGPKRSTLFASLRTELRGSSVPLPGGSPLRSTKETNAAPRWTTSSSTTFLHP